MEDSIMDGQEEYVLSNVIIKETALLQFFYHMIFKRKNVQSLGKHVFVTSANTTFCQLLLLIVFPPFSKRDPALNWLSFYSKRTWNGCTITGCFRQPWFPTTLLLPVNPSSGC